jgi:ABC-type branched-subunit amino acid transport system ATPase component
VNGQLLEVRNISKFFGGLEALSKVSFVTIPQTTVGIIGPNGAGKTTLFNLITGVSPCSSGNILFKDQDITPLREHVIARRGISRTFQKVQLFEYLNVFENIMIGVQIHYKNGFFSSATRTRGMKRAERDIRKKSVKILQLIGLEPKAHFTPHNLPIGEQKLLEIGRALATEPELLLLDEPAAGLNDSELETLKGLIASIGELGISILLVEHRMGLVMEVSDKVIVLNHGQKIAEGTPKEIQRNPIVITAYLGEQN